MNPYTARRLLGPLLRPSIMTRTIDFNDPRYLRFTELAGQLALLPREERAEAIRQALVQEHLAAQEAVERAAGLADQPLIQSIESMTTNELKALTDEVEASGLVATLREVLQASASPTTTACDLKNAGTVK